MPPDNEPTRKNAGGLVRVHPRKVADPELTQQFFETCGGKRPLDLLIRDTSGKDHDICFTDRPFLVMGRSDCCDIQLVDGNVSRRHIYLQLLKGGLACADLGSRNGTFWRQGQGLVAWLDVNDHLFVGKNQIRYRGPSPKPGRLKRPTQRIVDESSFALELLNGVDPSGRVEPGQRTGFLPIQRYLTLVGSGQRCKIKLDDERVARVHCSLILSGQGVWLVNLTSTEGTWVNGTCCDFCLLQHGDELQVGPFTLRFHVLPTAIRALGGKSVSIGLDETSPVVMPAGVDADRGEQQLTTDTWAADAFIDAESMRDLPVRQSQPPASPTREIAKVPSTGMTQHMPTGLSEDFVLSIIEQFTAMQQHYVAAQREQAEQSNQLAHMMMNMFGNLQQNQLDLIREDLDRVHAISAEIQKVQQDLLKEQLLRGTKTTSAANAAPDDIKPDVAASTTVQDADTAGGNTAGTDTTGSTTQSPADAIADDVVAIDDVPEDVVVIDDAEENTKATPTAGSPTKRVKRPKSSKTAKGERRKSRPTPDREQTNRQPAPKSTPADPTTADDDLLTHALLAERLAGLESERSSTWQRICGVLTGTRGG